MECRVPFTTMLATLMLFLALVPAVAIWALFMDLLTTSVDVLRHSTKASSDSMADGVQRLMISQATERLNARLTEGEKAVAVQSAMILASGLLAYDLHPSRFDIPREILVPYRTRDFATMKGHSYFSQVGLHGAIWKNTSGSNVTVRLFWITWSALYLDVATGALGQWTLYYSSLCLQPDEAMANYIIAYPDQNTGQPVFDMTNITVPQTYFSGQFAPSGWDKDLGFNPYTGQIELGRWQWFPAQNDTWLQASLSLNAQTISAELRSQLDGYPDDRLVIFFRQPHGHMIAASHGKFFSHSDVDSRYTNVLLHPPNVSAYRLWTCLESNDTLIPLACRQLYDLYQSWTSIPEDTVDMVLAGQQYWVATAHTTTNMQATVLLLKNRASVMGQIDSSNAEVDRQIANKKDVTYVVFGVVTAIAVVLPLGLGLWLSTRLSRLAAGMDQIATLQFNVGQAPPTVFSEVHRFQSSFLQMERGLQAFGKFVPQAVVRVLIAGGMASHNQMSNETLTIMFADIEGFTAVCETVPPDVLVEVCTEYFEAMCSSIVQVHGTIDKFIGDCIMAMWNAPQRRPGHERDAVSAALAMQDSVMQLHSGWQRRGQPSLKFRLGIHTGVCLVGNFGCSYRVSYTCLGDGVNLAARLEALNKRFGTCTCVSRATYESCQDDFHFRRLAWVTVPGKTEVLPVYEVLCPRGPNDQPPSPTSPRDSGLLALVDVVPGHHDAPAAARGAQQPMRCRLYCVDSSGPVPYHWQLVDREALLGQAEAYEAAYEAMVRGDLAAARLVLDAGAEAIPDRAWLLLEDQLQQLDAARPWDGVFYFREK